MTAIQLTLCATLSHTYLTVQFSSVAQSCPTLCDPMNRSTPSLPVHHQLPEFTQTHVHQVSDVIQPSHPLSSPSAPAPSPSQHQSLFQWVSSSHEVAKVLEFWLQHHSITSWEIDGETVETVSDFILGGSKITADGDCSHEIKRHLLIGRKVMTNRDSISKTLLCQQRSI